MWWALGLGPLSGSMCWICWRMPRNPGKKIATKFEVKGWLHVLLFFQFSRVVRFVIGGLNCGDTVLGVAPASWWDHAKCIALLFELRVDSGTLYLENHGGTKKHHRIQLNFKLLWTSPALDRSSGYFIIIQSSLAETWWLHLCHHQSSSQRLETGMVWIWGCKHRGLEFGHEVRMADGHPGLWKGKGKIFGTELGVLQHHQLCMCSSIGMVTWFWDTLGPRFMAFTSHSPHLCAGGTFMCPQPEVLRSCTASGANQWSHWLPEAETREKKLPPWELREGHGEGLINCLLCGYLWTCHCSSFKQCH